MDLTNEDVADILALLDSLPYDELDLRTDRFRLTLRRTAADGWTQESQLLTQPAIVTLASDGSAVSPLTTPDISEMSRCGTGEVAGTSGTADADGALWTGEVGGAATAGAAGLVAVVSPLPGTFYRAPRPGAAPFVEVGDAVAADTVVAIVETMKLMNSVPAGTPGRVARICAENGDFTPLGATLILIEP